MRGRSWHAGDVAIEAIASSELKALLLSDEDGFRSALQSVVQEVLEAEMTKTVDGWSRERGADGRTDERIGYRSGY
jgi:putative transposase